MATKRRDFLRNALITGSALTGSSLFAGPLSHLSKNSSPLLDQGMKEHFKLSVFSKNLQWLDYQAMAEAVAQMGFDGIDLTVRPTGHVVPEKVVDDLPRAVEIIKKAGLQVYMITTAIKDAKEQHAATIVKTAASLGIKHYRLGWFNYDEKKTIDENLKAFEEQLRGIAALSEQHEIYGEYQNHAGTYFGSSIWDLHSVLTNINSPWIGSQYDILHATVEGANSWPIGFKLLRPFIKSLDIKDFQWVKEDGKWKPEEVAVGEGMVDYKSFLSTLKKYQVSVPLSVHFEYALGGAENGATKLTIPGDHVIAAMKRDCAKVRDMLKTATLIE